MQHFIKEELGRLQHRGSSSNKLQITGVAAAAGEVKFIYDVAVCNYTL